VTSTAFDAAVPAARHPAHQRVDLRLVALAMLVLQLAWVFAVPPFRGSDEFDHVYKAAAVARGDWVPSPAVATRGTGAWLEVPSDIVRAARGECKALPYTVDADCKGEPHGATTRIASGAGRYHPLYYALVGTPALPFHGFTSLYVMRLASMLLCWLFFCAALAVTRCWARGPWPIVAVTLGSTPVLVYSSSIVAPNGLEMLAALTFWSALVGILRTDPGDLGSRVLVIGAAAGAVLCTTRPFGPLWCLLAGLTTLTALWPGRAALARLLRDTRVRIVTVLIVAAAAESTVWTLTMGAFNVGGELKEPLSLGGRFDMVTPYVPLWVLQSIAAFPLRNEPTQPVVYLTYLAIFGFLLAWALRRARGWPRLGLAVACVTALLVPYLIAVATFNSYAAVWQGRYGLPYSVGIVILVGHILDRASDGGVDPRLGVIGMVLYVIAQATGPADVMHKALKRPVDLATDWVHPAFAVVVALAALGAAGLWWFSVALPLRPPSSQSTPVSPDNGQ
jgi:hypothetical protein